MKPTLNAEACSWQTKNIVEPLWNGLRDLPAGSIASIVTHLEMTEAPTPRCLTVPEGLKLRLRKVNRPDPAWYTQLFRAIGREWLWFSRLLLTEGELAAIIQSPAVDIFALESDGIEKGFVELDRREFPEIEIAFFGLAADLIGKGAGTWMMAEALRRAWSHGPERVTLHTCTLDHPRALGFYLRAGFTAWKRSIEIADDPRLTGLLPRSAAPHFPPITAERLP
jgi:GNAT superfamily N-acetyltransferase